MGLWCRGQGEICIKVNEKQIVKLLGSSIKINVSKIEDTYLQVRRYRGIREKNSYCSI